MKKEIRTDSTWAKLVERGHLTDILFGLRDGTNEHGHFVVSGMNVSGMEIIYQRNVSGMILIQSGANLYLNNNFLI